VPRGSTRQRALAALVAVGVAVVVGVVTPVGAAVVAGLGDFSDWIKGKPGKPASAEEQDRFRGANGHSWASFLQGTQLRELIDTEVDGRRYVRFGFRSGQLVCLRLKAVSLAFTKPPACAPLTTLTHVSAPVVVVVGNDARYDEHNAPRLALSFGLVADGVHRVDVHAVDGTHEAVVGGNAYLWVQHDPNTAQQVTSVTTTDTRGQRITASVRIRDFLAIPVSGMPAASWVTARGPSHLQARIEDPTVRWFARHEARGASPKQAGLTREQRRMLPGRGFTRLVKPDPQSNVVAGLSQRDPSAAWCLVVVENGSSCSPATDFFRRSPLNVMYFGGGFTASDEFTGIAGVAADGVARVRIFLADGETQTASLRDNLFTALVPNHTPYRVVGYDGQGRVVGIETYSGAIFTARVPVEALHDLPVVLRARGPHGATAIVRARSTGGIRCRRLTFVPGRSHLRCTPRVAGGPYIDRIGVQPAGRDVFVYGDVGGTNTRLGRVTLLFDDGSTFDAVARGGMFVASIPAAHASPERHRAYLFVYDRDGRRLSRQAVYYRANR
jgi:hypothetical protein